MLIHGDCLEKLEELEDNSVDAVVTDPPYGLSFMGKDWDKGVPPKEIWIEVFRVLKHGGHLLSFGGTRTYHRMATAIEDAGFEIRDQLQWLYGSGFPKSYNVEKAVNKLGKDKAKYKGLGTALKPSNEPIVLARKPLSEKTIVDNVLKYGTGALNIDGCRVVADQALIDHSKKYTSYGQSKGKKSYHGGIGGQFQDASGGRWPANTILDEQAAEMLDEQSGISKSTRGEKKKNDAMTKNFKGGLKAMVGVVEGYNDKGGASRFFYCAKASKSERNAGLEHIKKEKQGARPNSKDSTGKFPDHDHRPTGGNNHPTVKPIKLMQYLVRLITPQGGTVLDPFMGSGSTGVACKNLNRKFIGIELDKEYFEIAKQRIEKRDTQKQLDLVKETHA